MLIVCGIYCKRRLDLTRLMQTDLSFNYLKDMYVQLVFRKQIKMAKAKAKKEEAAAPAAGKV